MILENIRKIIIIRHGATKLNSSNASKDRVKGWEDLPLTKKGKDEADKLSKKIVKFHPDLILSSSLIRAVDTAKIICKNTGIKYGGSSDGFLPWNTGNFKGQLVKDVMPILGDLIDNLPDEKIPGGESYNTFRDRFFKGLYQALKTHKGEFAIVTHSRNEQLLKSWQKNKYHDEGKITGSDYTTVDTNPGSIFEFEIPMDKLEKIVNGKKK